MSSKKGDLAVWSIALSLLALGIATWALVLDTRSLRVSEASLRPEMVVLARDVTNVDYWDEYEIRVEIDGFAEDVTMTHYERITRVSPDGWSAVHLGFASGVPTLFWTPERGVFQTELAIQPGQQMLAQWLNERDPDATIVDLVLLQIEYTDQNGERQSAYYRLSTYPDIRFQSQRRVSSSVAVDFLERAVITELAGYLPATTDEQTDSDDDFVCPDEVEDGLDRSKGHFVGFSPDPASGLPELSRQPRSAPEPRSAPAESQETTWLERCPSLTAPEGN